MDKNALFFEDGKFALPRTVQNIEDVPESHRDLYLPERGRTDGRHILDHKVWKEHREPFEREMERLERVQADLTAQHEITLAREREVLKTERIDATLHRTCVAAGISPGLIEGAIALMKGESTFDLDDSYQNGGYLVIANTAGALNSVETLVENFLDSDGGAAFRGKRRAAPSDDYFATVIAGLKQRR